ncbi:MAG: 23S rRNA (pseudouridine(1915)-N(3))-methyltransferase RlmH [Novosphingobium sp.]|nr:23S rRNA (pseudouridine(1915)-N(3))-methyltransferase RlmH [Novosphingobium sp.]
MLLHIVARGKIGRSPEAELVDRYLKRISWPVRLSELVEGAAREPPMLRPARLVLLDERGENLDSQAFAALLGSWRDSGMREARFVLGGADGHDAGVRTRCDLMLAFGRMTWPHLLARAMLAEQLWRATSILSGHPYHRSG